MESANHCGARGTAEICHHGQRITRLISALKLESDLVFEYRDMRMLGQEVGGEFALDDGGF